ncbi:hypothetical protein CGCVW01_v009838 [Colletotrichum viniferum]|nr:hypothetical protein CGCVW01_v009838 [Colletotrichum viniferum]
MDIVAPMEQFEWFGLILDLKKILINAFNA